MYCTDTNTGETLFHFPGRQAAQMVVLEMFAGGHRWRVQMTRSARDWVARLKLPCGWCIYRFEVDGKSDWDRSAGKMKTQDGRPCSLAVIPVTATSMQPQACNS